jgi:hypothetical protein
MSLHIYSTFLILLNFSHFKRDMSGLIPKRRKDKGQEHATEKELYGTYV